MSNKTTTSWILKLVDDVTKPLKSVTNSVSKSTGFIDNMTSSVKFNETETKKALSNSKKYYNDLEQQIKATEKEIKDLEKAKKSENWSEAMKASKAYDKATQKVKDLRQALQGAEDDIKDLTSHSEKFSNKAQKWSDVTTGINQATELMQKAVNGLDFTADVGKLRTEVARMTDLAGKDLDNFVYKSREIGDVYEQDSLEIARAANALTKQVGGSFEENLNLIEEGLKKGANSNGDFIDQLKEYPTFIDQLGISQSKAIAFMAKAGKEGIFSDKAIDSLKEAGLALNEMGKPQLDALKANGIDYDKDLKGKSQFEAIQFIAQNMKGATAQARQLIISDIFKGAGEDAGNKLFEILANGVPNLEEMPAVEQAGAGMKTFFSNLKTWAGLTFGSIGTYASQLSPIVMTVSGLIPIMQMLGTSTKFQALWTGILTKGQWLLNVAMNANPIGLIVLGIAALVGVIALVWNKFEGFRRVVFQGWEALKLFGSVIKDFVIERIKGLLSGITGIGKALLHFFNGEWSQAWETGKQAASDIVGIDAGVNAAKKFKDGWAGAMSDGLEAHQKNEAERNSKKQNDSNGVNDYVLGTSSKTLGEINKDGNNGKKNNGNPIEVGAGNNGLKSIVMNLTVNNSFNVNKDTDTRSIADKITSEINDRLRDSVISLG